MIRTVFMEQPQDPLLAEMREILNTYISTKVLKRTIPVKRMSMMN
jgi:hypothetical protein